MKQRVLWIEDSALDQNASLAGPVHLSGRYDLTIALTATEGFDALSRSEFDAVIVDIRIPPGDDRRWVDMYYRSFLSSKAARLGLRLLDTVLTGPNTLWPETLPASAREPAHYGVLTVEGIDELRDDLTRLRVTVYRDKGGSDTPDTLLEMIEVITSQAEPTKTGAT